ncbi:tetratricopeptide repeat-containing sensor histidine kinase [Spirosoma panaciterrae]|uniref:tetratricopeptide repeat-containing sensor histidine kinase n=1 Tax=Spirosoma panaciterrae TaxID=496058 RepID=UPI00035F0EE9|nr:tetratricopeptide repeat-containing sensor histidine kinase [Spirosoma panaciterrae]
MFSFLTNPLKHSCSLLSVILSLILAGISPVLAQVPKSLDSLETYVRTHTPTDTNYVIALNELGNQLTRKKADYDRADSVLHLAESIARRLNFGRGMYRANTNMGSNYYLSNRPQQTLESLRKAHTIAEAYKLDTRTIARALTNLGTAYRNAHQFEKSIEVYLRSLRMQEQYNLQPRNEDTYNGIGLALKDMHRTQEAISYFKQALTLNQALKNAYGIAICEQNIGKCYDDLEQPAKALSYYKSARSHAREAESELLQSDILVNTGLALRKAKRFDEARQAIEQALVISRKQENQSAMATDYFNLGQVYEEQKDYKLAERYMKQALSLANALDDKPKIAIYTQGLANLYGGMKDFQQAYVYQLERNQEIDSTTTVRTNAEVQRLITKYETEKKEAQIKLLRQEAQLRQQETQRTRLLLIGSVLLLLLVGVASAWLLNRSKLRRLEEAHRLRQQIAHDLHDEVGSTLSSISMLSGHTDTLLSQNKPESAQKMVQKIYTDARQILESVDEIIWTINPGNDSLHRIALRLQEYAQPLMEAKGIRFHFTVDPALANFLVSMEKRRNLYLIGKEGITNLIKYSQASEASVRFEQKDQQVRVLIEDNGQGFVQAQYSLRTGQTSMQQRAKAMGGSLEVRSAPKQGTRLVVTTFIN